jgi:hypothetical protein
MSLDSCLPVSSCLNFCNNCFSVAIQLASHVDLNTLHALSLTSHLIRSSLLQSRTQLRARTLRCINDVQSHRGILGGARRAADDASGTTARIGARLREQGMTTASGSYDLMSALRMTSGRVGPCARDLVGSCRKCANVVCRVSPMLACVIFS